LGLFRFLSRQDSNRAKYEGATERSDEHERAGVESS